MCPSHSLTSQRCNKGCFQVDHDSTGLIRKAVWRRELKEGGGGSVEGRMKNENVINSAFLVWFFVPWYMQVMKDIPAHWGKHLSLLTGRGEPTKDVKHPKEIRDQCHHLGVTLLGKCSKEYPSFLCSCAQHYVPGYSLVLFLYFE